MLLNAAGEWHALGRLVGVAAVATVAGRRSCHTKECGIICAGGCTVRDVGCGSSSRPAIVCRGQRQGQHGRSAVIRTALWSPAATAGCCCSASGDSAAPASNPRRVKLASASPLCSLATALQTALERGLYKTAPKAAGVARQARVARGARAPMQD